MRVSPVDLIAKYWHLTPQTNTLLGHPVLKGPITPAEALEERDDLRQVDLRTVGHPADAPPSPPRSRD